MKKATIDGSIFVSFKSEANDRQNTYSEQHLKGMIKQATEEFTGGLEEYLKENGGDTAYEMHVVCPEPVIEYY